MLHVPSTNRVKLSARKPTATVNWGQREYYSSHLTKPARGPFPQILLLVTLSPTFYNFNHDLEWWAVVIIA